MSYPVAERNQPVPELERLSRRTAIQETDFALEHLVLEDNNDLVWQIHGVLHRDAWATVPDPLSPLFRDASRPPLSPVLLAEPPHDQLGQLEVDVVDELF